MNVRFSIQKLHLVTYLVLAAPVAFAAAQTRTNPPSECQTNSTDRPCNSEEEASDDCIKANLDMGRTTPWTGSRPCSLKVFADDQSPMVFTPEVKSARHQ